MAANEVINLRSFDEEPGLNGVEPMQFNDELPAGTRLLNEQYTITGYLNSGGFGITYIAEDSLHRTVVIKECFPGFMCRRVGKDVRVRSVEHQAELTSIVSAFINEARALAALNHDGIVKVHQVFQENQTAYMAMDYVKGLDLAEIIERHPGAVSPARIVKLTRRILGVVDYVHQRGILHRDISPDNIIISKSGEPLLIDFGSAYEHVKKAGTETQQLKCVKDGYSPQEFYVPDGEQGPWSDLYSLAATLYDVLMDGPPVAAQPRLAALAKGEPDPYVPLAGNVEGYPSKYLKAIDTALAVMPEQRFQSAQDWMARITTRKRTAPAPVIKADRTKRPTMLLEQKFDERPDVEPTEDEPGLMAAVQTAAELRDAHIRSLISDEPAAEPASKAPMIIVSAITLAIGVGGIGYFQFMQPPTEAGSAETAQAAQTADVAQAAIVEAAPSVSVPQALDPTPAPAPLRGAFALQPVEIIASPQPTQVTQSQPQAAPFVDESTDAMGLAALAQAGGFSDPVLPLAIFPGAFVVDAPVSPTVLAQFAAIAAEEAARAAFIAQLSDIAPVVGILDMAQDAPTLGEVSLAMSWPVTLDTALTADHAPMPGAKKKFAEAPFAFATKAPAPLPKKAPKPVVLGKVLDQQVAFSHWDLDMPFTAQVQRVRNAAVATITDVNPSSDLALSGSWIQEGVAIYTYNGAALDTTTPLSGQVLNALAIDPDGYSRGSVRYRDPTTGKIDRGLLAVPVVREIGLADGSMLSARMSVEAWTLRVEEAAPSGPFQAGDILMRETTTGTQMRDHRDLTQAFEQLMGSGLTEATFELTRAGQVLRVQYPLARAPAGSGQNSE